MGNVVVEPLFGARKPMALMFGKLTQSARPPSSRTQLLKRRCVPFKYFSCDENCDTNTKKIIKVLMINSTSGPGLLFPKGGWENDETVTEAAVREAIEEAGVRGVVKEYLDDYEFRSKSHQDELSPEGWCKASMFALYVDEELESWPEQETRERKWLTIQEAAQLCRHSWMKDALFKFAEYYDNADNNDSNITTEDDSIPASR